MSEGVIVTGACGVLGEAVVLAREAEGATVARLDYVPAPHGAPDTFVGGVDLADETAAREAVGFVVACMEAHAASKAAVARLTESLTSELAGRDVTVNAVLPTIIDTPANRRDMPHADHGQWVKPQAIADVVAFSASPAARSISGTSIPVSRSTP